MAPTLVHTAFLLVSIIFIATTAKAGTVRPGHGHLHERHHDLHKRAPAISPNLNNWSSVGCYTDDVNARTLSQGATVAQTMTEESCVAFCQSNGYLYAGVEYGTECFCGRDLATSKKTGDGECNMPCAGAATELCGGSNRLNVFKNDNYNPAAVGPTTNPGPPKWGFLGCYVDGGASRSLPVVGASQGGAAALTVALCTDACLRQGYKFAGVEYAGECYCGDTLSNSLLAPDGLAGCNMVCNGNSTEFCGGPNRLDAYALDKSATITTKWTSLGCYTDTVDARTLRYGAGVPGGQPNMTNQNCQDACRAAGYSIAGTEYSQECWCDNVVSGAGGPAPDGNAQCNMACRGDGSQMCGGPNRLNAWTLNAAVSTSATTTTSKTTSALVATSTSKSSSTITSTSTSTTTSSSKSSSTSTSTSTSKTTSTSTTTTTTTTTSSTSTTTKTTAATTAVQSSVPTGWSYRGCYVDNANGRILTQQPDSPSMTVESCIATCQTLGKHVAGLEYSTQCFCGDSIVNGGVTASDDSQCAMTCGGTSKEICGGPNRMSVWATGNLTSYGAPKALNSTLPGNWKYKGCLSDQAQPRTLPYEINMPSNLTVPACLNLCLQYGYSAAAVEYGQECYCGDDTDRVNAGSTFRAEADCNTPCPGAPETLCGGANAMNYYTADNLNTWGQATGDAAGKYEFLIPGLIVPLIATVGVNNKVMFVEKHGTGVGNSTGSYELDMAQVNNFDKAWRMIQGLKTDVFCSASLTLPDKAGRMINIGGWSAQSLFGLRFYTPDGSPGQPSRNNWEENVNEVALQVGRWYPSAMQMVNGSILVVGGEDGSNGQPVPNLEVIPRPAGGRLMYMDWLERTDPNNLYPYLTILPSGNIAVFYYNEARILDERTFETIRTLPNIPGAVNNALAGRTYPMEGTSMLLPQRAPYTDPLGVLICGGSTPYAGIALDNCVTIQPEVPGANWTIERMPSKRVLTCMVALPDGTYLIMNGANQGLAGFGLATDPNHMAMLYDPTKPQNKRFTRMANTTIDRLYHSEAILLPDGRVLVSGSDPEDDVHIQEYRVEVFTPPYLMGNLAASRPAYTINNNHTDWAFNERVTITITSGSVASVSLMGAVSSTHGNSMGQRTLIPAFSCSGNQCTITAPPNGYVTGGPNWFMLFVLNAKGTPSYSQWVRIGGDPAGLGNWPNFSDFSLPGVGSNNLNGAVAALSSNETYSVTSTNSTRRIR